MEVRTGTYVYHLHGALKRLLKYIESLRGDMAKNNGKGPRTLTREQMAEMFEAGIVRKNAEQNTFGMRALDRPDRQAIYSDLYDFLDLEIRYYHVAARYFRDDIDSLDNGGFEDLLLLTSVDLSPRMYAIYLREIDPADRDDERITRDALKDLKKAIRKAMGKD